MTCWVMRISVKGDNMPKTIFHTTEKSNFILNMDLDAYRNACGKIMLIILWATAVSQGIHQLTYSVNMQLADMVANGGFGAVIAMLLVTFRSVATVFSLGGVAALIVTVIGLMRKQIPQSAAIPYLLLVGSLAWAVISLFHSFDLSVSLFGQDGRDEGWFALLMYAAMFYLGTMLRRKHIPEAFLSGVMVFGIVQCAWGMMQAFTGAASQYGMIEPLLYQNLRLPSGMTDSPITFAMLLAMLLAVSIPAAMFAAEKKTRTLGAVCACCSMLMVFKTQTAAGLIAGIGAVLLTAGLLIINRKKGSKSAWKIPVAVLASAVVAAGWVFVSPSLNGAYMTANDEALENGFALYDGGIVWDDGYYRLGTAGPYSNSWEHDFDIYNAGSVLRHCQNEGIKAIAKYPLLGTGPDNFGFTQLHISMEISQNPNSVDRPYNDFIFIAATRGVLSLLLHLALIVICLMRAWKRRKSGEWTLLAAACAVVLYALTSLVGISVLTVAPVFWMLLGTLAAEPIADAPKPVKQTASKQNKSKKKK